MAVASSPPLGLNATENVALLLPVANGEPATLLSEPPAPTANTGTALSSVAAASSRPSGLNATDAVKLLLPVANGEPATVLSEPPAPTANTDTVEALALPVASSPPLGLNATESGLSASA